MHNQSQPTALTELAVQRVTSDAPYRQNHTTGELAVQRVTSDAPYRQNDMAT
ncbi:MAG: hypothetical protein ACR2QE_18420 [Acidimicrobiales bacterium]